MLLADKVRTYRGLVFPPDTFLTTEKPTLFLSFANARSDRYVKVRLGTAQIFAVRERAGVEKVLDEFHVLRRAKDGRID